MAIPLQQLLGVQTLDSIRTKVIAKLQGRALPTTDFSPTGIERTMIEMVSLALQDLVVNGIPIAVGGGFVDYAVGDWLTQLSTERYNNTRNAATYTLGLILLTNSTSQPIALTANQLWFSFPSLNAYNGPPAPATIPANGSLAILVQSESPNHSIALSATDTLPLVNYVDGSGLVITMTTPLPGVTASNFAPPYSATTQVGLGSGTLTPTGTPSGTHNILVRIDVSGQVGGQLIYSYSLDGAAYVTGQTAATQTNIGGSGIGFLLANGAGNPSFVAGAVLGFSTPGTWITQQGTDAEYDAALATRDKNKWPSLATLAAIPGSPTLGFYDLLARQPIPPALSSQVTQTLIQTDPNINNRVNIYVAGQGGILPPTAVAALNSYLTSLNMLTDSPLALSPAVLAIVLGGLTITVRQASLLAAQASLQASLATFFAALGINASTTNGVIRHARIIQIIEDTFGITDVSDTTMTINGAAQSLLLPTAAAPVQLPQWSQSIATAATWLTV